MKKIWQCSKTKHTVEKENKFFMRKFGGINIIFWTAVSASAQTCACCQCNRFVYGEILSFSFHCTAKKKNWLTNKICLKKILTAVWKHVIIVWLKGKLCSALCTGVTAVFLPFYASLKEWICIFIQPVCCFLHISLNMKIWKWDWTFVPYVCVDANRPLLHD